MATEVQAPVSIGLGGDGDEICAIKNVEGAFDIRFSADEAEGWLTAGDVFASLLLARPALSDAPDEAWRRLAEALTGTTGVDPYLISQDSPLLAPSPNWGDATTWIARLWFAMALLAVAMAIVSVAL